MLARFYRPGEESLSEQELDCSGLFFWWTELKGALAFCFILGILDWGVTTELNLPTH